MNILVINGHKYYPYAQGKLNKTLFDVIVESLNSSNEIQTTIIENGYNINEEIEKYKRADLVIFQTPVNWFSVPWSFKKYIDEIYQHGVFYGPSQKYGRGGLFTDKFYMFSFTCNAPRAAYEETDGFFDGRSFDDVMVALHKLHEFCGMKKLKTFCAYDVVHNPNIEKYISDLKKHLEDNILNAQF